MRLLAPDHLTDTDELESYSIRRNVKAIRCDDGATLTDDDGQALATYAGPCYVLIDGDDARIVTAFVFDAVFAPASDDDEPEPAPSYNPAPSFDPSDASHADPRASAGTATTPETTGGSLYADNPATLPNTPPTQTAPPADQQGQGGTPGAPDGTDGGAQPVGGDQGQGSTPGAPDGTDGGAQPVGGDQGQGGDNQNPPA